MQTANVKVFFFYILKVLPFNVMSEIILVPPNMLYIAFNSEAGQYCTR